VAGTPTPYYVPLYRELARDPRLDFTVIYASTVGIRTFDFGYGQPVSWDMDLVSGYRHLFLEKDGETSQPGEGLASLRNSAIVPVLMRGRYEVMWVGGYNSITYLLAIAAQRVTGGHVLFREDQTLLDPRPIMNVLAKEFALRALFSHGRALYTSTENRRWFEHYGVPDERLFEARHSVDNETFRADAAGLRSKRHSLREEMGIERDSGPVIVTVSRLIPKKQPLFLLEAFRRVRERRRCTLLFVGSGPLEGALRERVEAGRIPDVVFAGFLNRSQISRAYAVGDVFALLSREKETFGLAVAEAMNFALPIVASDRVGCAPDLVSTDYNGFVVSHRDPAKAAAALERLVSDEKMRTTMGAASAERIAEWSIPRTAAGIVAAAADAVANRSPA
jgi:glycosyltransferase involved in cell wall biosynthesis